MDGRPPVAQNSLQLLLNPDLDVRAVREDEEQVEQSGA